MSTDFAVARSRLSFSPSFLMWHLRMASFCRSRPHSRGGRLTRPSRAGRGAFLTPYSSNLPKKAAQGRGLGQGKRRT
ncbi:Uncharacterized protein HZ326_26425 [Fusarium oxysporum f. sp. albedinis]|nr:Uncharacterized protein HZ326_26425 [Fusarium oxysporum f. sp. albedinis]